MSIAVMTEVWKDAPVAGTELLLLLALADSANDDRECWPSFRHLQHKVRVSRPQLKRLIQKLIDAGLIEKVVKGGKGTKGRESNLYKILSMTGVAHEPGEGSHTNPVEAGTGVAGEPLNRHLDSSIKPVSPSGDGQDSESEKLKKARAANPMYDVVLEVWKLTAERNGLMQGLLTGTAKRNGWKQYNLETPITPEQVREWAAWYKRANPGISVVSAPDKVQSSITYWQTMKEQAQAKQAEQGGDPAQDLHVAVEFDPAAQFQQVE